MTVTKTRTENKTKARIFQFNGGVGSYLDVEGAWLIDINDKPLAEFRPGRGQPDRQVFRSRRAAREAAKRIAQIKVVPEYAGSHRLYAIPA